MSEPREKPGGCAFGERNGLNVARSVLTAAGPADDVGAERFQVVSTSMLRAFQEEILRDVITIIAELAVRPHPSSCQAPPARILPTVCMAQPREVSRSWTPPPP